jgi:hypothetical protein
VQDSAPNIYKNPKGTIFLTVGTGGAYDMQLSSLKDFSAEWFAGSWNSEYWNRKRSNSVVWRFYEKWKETKNSG